jgi:hypothetical protein
MKEDPIVDEVRKIREELDRQFNFDINAVFADIRKRQESLGSRLVRQCKVDEPPVDGDVTLHNS